MTTPLCLDEITPQAAMARVTLRVALNSTFL
jgi:hypothetical protein